MEDNILRKVQLEQLYIMDAIHDICVENSIEYYIIGGTALGAIRHKGFIPWDVDIDIAMTRDNYKKFAKIFKCDSIRDLTYNDYTSLKLYNPPHAIITKNGTKLFRNDRAYDERFRPMGIFVDVLPIDNAPDNQTLRNIQSTILRWVAKLKYYKIASYFPEKVGLKKFARLLTRGILGMLPMRFLNIIQQQVMMAFNSRSTNCLCSMSSHYSYRKQCMSKEVYGAPILIKFEGLNLYAPNDVLKYLEIVYGDYSKLPDESDQAKQKSYFSGVKL